MQFIQHDKLLHWNDTSMKTLASYIKRERLNSLASHPWKLYFITLSLESGTYAVGKFGGYILEICEFDFEF